jgi:hypothetical protein
LTTRFLVKNAFFGPSIIPSKERITSKMNISQIRKLGEMVSPELRIRFAFLAKTRIFGEISQGSEWPFRLLSRGDARAVADPQENGRGAAADLDEGVASVRHQTAGT